MMKEQIIIISINIGINTGEIQNYWNSTSPHVGKNIYWGRPDKLSVISNIFRDIVIYFIQYHYLLPTFINYLRSY